jgi:hypothetical protein
MKEVSMLRSRRTFLTFALIVCSVTLLTVIPRALADGFDGKWKVKVEPDEDSRKAGERDFDDTLTFTANKFVSEACKKHGFGETTYDEDTRRFGPATFTAEATSDKEGKEKWTGTITASEIEGEMTWTKKDGSEVHFTYKGSKS